MFHLYCDPQVTSSNKTAVIYSTEFVQRFLYLFRFVFFFVLFQLQLLFFILSFFFFDLILCIQQKLQLITK